MKKSYYVIAITLLLGSGIFWYINRQQGDPANSNNEKAVYTLEKAFLPGDFKIKGLSVEVDKAKHEVVYTLDYQVSDILKEKLIGLNNEYSFGFSFPVRLKSIIINPDATVAGAPMSKEQQEYSVAMIYELRDNLSEDEVDQLKDLEKINLYIYDSDNFAVHIYDNAYRHSNESGRYFYIDEEGNKTEVSIKD